MTDVEILATHKWDWEEDSAGVVYEYCVDCLRDKKDCLPNERHDAIPCDHTVLRRTQKLSPDGLRLAEEQMRLVLLGTGALTLDRINCHTPGLTRAVVGAYLSTTDKAL